MAAFRLTPAAIDDLDEIWSFIFRDDPRAADAVEREIRSSLVMLAKMPLSGRERPELTKLAVRFWTVPRYPNYIVVYKTDSDPLEIIRVLHGMQNLKRILE